jgi:hypothetical protein
LGKELKSIVVSAITIAGLALAGCGGVASAADSMMENPSISERSTTLRNNILNQAIAMNASPFQIGILQQDDITFEDIRLAHDYAFRCMTNNGIEVTQIHEVVSPDGNLGIQYAVPASGEAIWHVCWQRYLQWVVTFWGIGTPAALHWFEAEQVAITPYMWNCLTDKGVDLTDIQSIEDLSLLAWQRPTLDCVFIRDGETVTPVSKLGQ